MKTSKPSSNKGNYQKRRSANSNEVWFGVRFEFDNVLKHHRPYITFPYGYDYTSNEDVLCLISVLSDYQREMQNVVRADLTKDEQQGFPIQSYHFVIQDYLSNGYYTERETMYASRANGKVNWGRTVKKEKPVIQDNGAIYLNLQTRLHHSNDEHIMTEISKHCVYESFAKLGWYYGLSTPSKPSSTLYKTQFIAILRDKLHKANKDMDKQLFQSMINVLLLALKKGIIKLNIFQKRLGIWLMAASKIPIHYYPIQLW